MAPQWDEREKALLEEFYENLDWTTLIDKINKLTSKLGAKQAKNRELKREIDSRRRARLHRVVGAGDHAGGAVDETDDGGGAMTYALFGGNLGKLAEQNGWAGVVVHGCVRDTAELSACAIGIKALAAHPKRSDKRGL